MQKIHKSDYITNMKFLRGQGILTGGGLMMVLVLTSSYAASLSEEEVATRVRAISKTLRCAVCQSESVWESNAPLAAQMRDLVQERVMAGESDDAIRAYFVSRYGDFILLSPRVRGLNHLLWFGPFLFLLFLGAFLYWKMRQWTQQESTPATLLPLSIEERKRIDETVQAYKNPEQG